MSGRGPFFGRNLPPRNGETFSFTWSPQERYLPDVPTVPRLVGDPAAAGPGALRRLRPVAPVAVFGPARAVHDVVVGRERARPVLSFVSTVRVPDWMLKTSTPFIYGTGEIHLNT